MNTSGLSVKESKVLFFIQQIGPYHHDRFQALAKAGLTVEVVETRPQDTTYSWHTTFNHCNYTRASFSTKPAEMRKRMQNQTIFICGWFDKEMLLALFFSVLFGVKRIIISDSKENDAPRTWIKESVKRLILKLYHGALVAGKESTEYLKILGFQKTILTPWDVVADSENNCQKKNNEWIFPARLVPKKNHSKFLEIYAQFLPKSKQQPKLVLCGDGELENELREQVKQLGIEKDVMFLGFVQSSELKQRMACGKLVVLPSVTDQWGLVVNEALVLGVPVLVSTGCGAKELVNNANGWVLNFQKPINELVEALLTIENEAAVKHAVLPQSCSMEAFVTSIKKLSIPNV